MATLKIKNMVCDRCIMTVRDEFSELGYTVNTVSLGEVKIEESPTLENLEDIAEKLNDKGFELITNKGDALLEQIKVHLITYLDYIEEGEEVQKISAYLEDKLNYNYAYISDYFSQNSGSTIEKYLINLKIERVKELLSYEELTLSEIAWKLNYSSVQYLSNQFKRVTGETVSSFRKHMDEQSRQSLDSIS
ncbi:AraC family transcriptional regulator [Fodinibius sp. Rm-B-1B1-1]|uniref:AraC family transcriptional regulator n=1 Tax=Fodinibius alkaliphilus TaxID=3140241 RepID=UPI003159E56A